MPVFISLHGRQQLLCEIVWAALVSNANLHLSAFSLDHRDCCLQLKACVTAARLEFLL